MNQSQPQTLPLAKVLHPKMGVASDSSSKQGPAYSKITIGAVMALGEGLVLGHGLEQAKIGAYPSHSMVSSFRLSIDVVFTVSMIDPN
jgi:hypothetical protein